MASSLSYELLVAKSGAANGLATLDGTGKVPVSQLPAAAIETFKGTYATSAALIAAFPTGSTGDYAYVTATLSYWYWNAALVPAAWDNQQIPEATYLTYTAAQQGGVPYIVTP